MGAGATLRDFALRASTLALYRAYLRLLPAVPDGDARASLRATVRAEFTRFGRSVEEATRTPLAARRAALADGQRHLKVLAAQIATLGGAAPAGVTPTTSRHVAATAAAIAAGTAGRSFAAAPPQLPAAPPRGVSVEDGVAADVRGRMGVAWPWQTQ